MAPVPPDSNSIWWYLLHSPDQYMLLTHAPAWLAGSVMAVFSGLFGALSFALLKIAYARQDKKAKELAREMDEPCEDDEQGDDRRRRKYSFASMIEMERAVQKSLPWCLPPLFWLGLLLYLVAGALYVLALTFAPETTVAPMGSVQVMANVPLAYGMVHERFSQSDLIATAVCVLSMTVAVFVMPKDIIPPLGSNEDIVREFIEFSFDMTNNYGFLCYVIVWTLLVLICVNANFVVQSKVKRPMRAFTEPTLAGLFLAAFSFLVKLFGTLFYHSDQHPEVWNHRSTHLITGSMILFGLISLLTVCQGIRHFDCRFFVPSTFGVTTVLMIVQGFLFFKEYEGMGTYHLIAFTLACSLAVSSVFFISWERNTVHKPAASAAGLEPESPLAMQHMPQPTAEETAVLTIMEEHGTRAIEKPGAWKLDGVPWSANGSGAGRENGFSNDSSSGEGDSDTDSEFFSHSSSEAQAPYADVEAERRWLNRRPGRLFTALVRLHPLFMFLLIPTVCSLLFKVGYVWQAFAILTSYYCWYTYKFGPHIALFSNVGRMKIKAYSAVNFEEMFRRLRAYPESPESLAPYKFEEVLHFVILTNYKEDVQVMKEAIFSVADSKISRRQITLVLAMEQREDGAAEKAKGMIDEMGSLFRHMIYTLHPPGLPGEVPGKSANCRWAAQRLFDEYIPNWGYDMKRVVMTVMDADSEFHPEYFSALTYQFLSAPGDAARYQTIWQAPIIHYKNYHSQPHIVRLGSLLTSQHELANLADPYATRLPYSTYSISGILARAVDGWDPDWISEDWHMCCKCFIATLGSLQISPIFLPVLNYTPEADGCLATIWERWVQAKRHALGVSELVYLVSSIPGVLADRHFSLDRRVHLAYSASFLWFKMIMVHGAMATNSIIGPINGVLITYILMNHAIDHSMSFTFLANCVFQILGVTTFVFYLYTNVRLYDKVADRIVGYDDPSTRAWYGRTSTHFLTLVVGCFPMAPFLFLTGGICEWIAAVKTAVTHKFDYVVALKPQAASAKTVTPA